MLSEIIDSNILKRENSFKEVEVDHMEIMDQENNLTDDLFIVYYLILFCTSLINFLINLSVN